MEYRSVPGVNWSTLKHLRTSAKEYQFQLANPREDTAYFRIGRGVHTLILEPEKFATRHPLFEGAARRGKAWDQFLLDHPGIESENVLINSEFDKVLGCAEAVKDDPLAAKHFHAGVCENVITWTDRDTDIDCKARCDSVNGHLVELKSTSSIIPRVFASDAAKLGYHGQIAFYLDGLLEQGILESESVLPPAIVAVESEPPHDVVTWLVAPETVEAGRCLYKRLLMTLKQCRESNIWPGLGNGVEIPWNLPEWAISELEEDEPNRTITIGGVAVRV